MKKLLVYYGWLNSFNSASNSWDNDNVAADLAQYDMLVFGAGLEDPSHGDYANTKAVIGKIKTLKPDAKIFGYVTVAQDLVDFQGKVNKWDTLEVDGIFFDEAGYDFGKTRQELNQRIDFVRNTNFARLCFVNAWNVQHVLGTDDDASYPNTTFNPTLDASMLTSDDWYMLESFPLASGTYETLSQNLDRGSKAKKYQDYYSIKLASVSIIDDADVDGQAKFDHVVLESHLYLFDACGSSSLSYGSPSSAVNKWSDPDMSYLYDGADRK